ncbi:MAG: PaaI family thioesterase [Pseudomonadota bacterium]
MAQDGAPRWATGPDELLSPVELGTMSGLEFIVGMAEGRLPNPPILRLMRAHFVAVEKGLVVVEAVPHFDHYNPLGAVHGGWFGALLDTALACAVQTTLPKGKGYTTLEYRVNIIRPVLAETGPVIVTGEVDHSGRRTGVSHARMEAADGKLYATGSTTCLVLDLPTVAQA